MIQSHSIILWAEARETTIDEQVDMTFNCLSALKRFGDELSPVYLTANSKNEARLFELSKSCVEEVLKKSTVKINKQERFELGRTFSFFSSLKEEESCRISLTIGATSSYLNNSLVVSLPYGNFTGITTRIVEFSHLFKELVIYFSPYFAFVANSRNMQISEQLWSNGKPTFTHWINFYNNSLSQKIGLAKMKATRDIEQLSDGYYLKIQEGPIDINKPEHLQIQKAITEQLGL